MTKFYQPLMCSYNLCSRFSCFVSLLHLLTLPMSYSVSALAMVTSSIRNIFRVTGPLCGGTHRSLVNSPHKGQWHGALMYSVICAWTKGSVNNRDVDDLRLHRAHYDVTLLAMLSRHGCFSASETTLTNMGSCTMKPVCTDHLYNKIYYLRFIQ